MTQVEAIIKFIREHGSITPMDAFGQLGITKLATRVSEMIRDGYPVQKIREEGVNRYGEKTHYMRYWMED